MGMGTIDEGYVENNNGSEQLSPVIIQTKYPMMIPTPSQNHSLTAGGTTKDEVLDRLKYESSRLLTFDKWPASAKVEPRKIAKAGFFYTGQYAEAKCLWCNCVITTWDYGDQAMTRHRSASPDCPFVRDVSDNIPLLTSATSSSNIMSPQSDENTTHVDPSFDRVDFWGQNATGSNNNTSAISTNTESTDTQTEQHDIRVRCIQIECQKIQPDCILDVHQMRQECKHLGIGHHHPSDKQKEVQVIFIIPFLVVLYQEIPLTDQLLTHYCPQT
jgi:hypothetical protein